MNPADGDPQITIRLISQPTPEIETLVTELNQELAQLYTQDQQHGLDLEALFQPGILFLQADFNGQPAGCGGIALNPKSAELKRMYVRPAFRGTPVASTLIQHLEQEAQKQEIPVINLETGIHQHAAIRFYKRQGYQPCPAFEPYSSMPEESIATSIFYEKRLTELT